MKISEKQIMQLMSIVRECASLCARLNVDMDLHEKCKALHREIENQQSEELKVIE